MTHNAVISMTYAANGLGASYPFFYFVPECCLKRFSEFLNLAHDLFDQITSFRERANVNDGCPRSALGH